MNSRLGSAIGVERQRLSVSGRDEEDAVRGAVYAYVVKVDRRRINGTVQRDLLATQRRNVAGGNAGLIHRRAGAARVPTEAGPVVRRKSALYRGRRRGR